MMRDRLKKLILENDILCHTCGENTDSYCAEHLAEYLIENGVIVPPCKANDKIFALGAENGVLQIKECTVDYLGFEDANSLEVRVMFECDYDCEGCYFSSWSQMHCGEWTCSGEYGEGVIPIDDFGKTVFLTREEAEQASKGGEQL